MERHFEVIARHNERERGEEPPLIDHSESVSSDDPVDIRSWRREPNAGRRARQRRYRGGYIHGLWDFHVLSRRVVEGESHQGFERCLLLRCPLLPIVDDEFPVLIVGEREQLGQMDIPGAFHRVPQLRVVIFEQLKDLVLVQVTDLRHHLPGDHERARLEKIYIETDHPVAVPGQNIHDPGVPIPWPRPSAFRVQRLGIYVERGDIRIHRDNAKHTPAHFEPTVQKLEFRSLIQLRPPRRDHDQAHGKSQNDLHMSFQEISNRGHRLPPPFRGLLHASNILL